MKLNMKGKIVKACSIMLLFIVFIQTPPKSYSKYYSVVPSASSSKIASYVFLSSVDFDIPITLDKKLYPGITYEYPIVIRNYDGNIRCKVDLNYSLSIDRTNNLPVEIKLYKDDVLLEDNKIENQELNHSIDEIHNYKIVITWDKALNDYKYADITDYINLYVNVSQVD